MSMNSRKPLFLFMFFCDRLIFSCYSCLFYLKPRVFVRTDFAGHTCLLKLWPVSRKKISTLCSLLNWLHHPLVLESGEFFVSRSIFSRLCRVLNVSEDAEFSSPSVY